MSLTAAARHEIGNMLAGARRAHGLTQHALSSAIGVSRVHLAHVEIGRKAPSLVLIGRIAHALDLSALEKARIVDLATAA